MADYICTVERATIALENRLQTKTPKRFFGNRRCFMQSYMRQFARKRFALRFDRENPHRTRTTNYENAIFENLIADVFSKMDRYLYYFREDSGLELDFVIRYKGKCTPVEIKANDGNAKREKTMLKHPEKYHVDSAIKLADLNV